MLNWQGFSTSSASTGLGKPVRHQGHLPRLFLEDRLVHHYVDEELEEAARFWLIPWCQEDTPYPDRHASEELSDETRQARAACGPCTARYLTEQARRRRC